MSFGNRLRRVRRPSETRLSRSFLVRWAVTVLVVVLVIALNATGSSVASKNRTIKSLQGQVSSTQAQLASDQKALADAKDELAGLNDKVTGLQNQVGTLSKSLKAKALLPSFISG